MSNFLKSQEAEVGVFKGHPITAGLLLFDGAK